MKKVFWVLILGLGFFITLFLLRAPSSSQESITQQYVPNEVLVKFKPEAGKQKALTALDVLKPRVVNYLGQEIAFSDWNPEVRAKSSFLGDPYLIHLRVPEAVGTEKAIAILKNNPNVDYAEPNYIYTIMETIPNDPYFPKLWNLKNTGQTGGKPGADIKATYAWDIFTGSPDVVVAIIDTGIDYNHPDLAQNIWINTKEIPNNNIDDDGNGYIDDYMGWNFVSNNNDPMDDVGHGTHVSGIIGAKGNNSLGVVGVCWNIRLMALKAGNKYGLQEANIVKAIDYAWKNGAKISNNSYGSYRYSQAIFDAISRANNSGHLFVAAAGNERNDNDKNPAYPASYKIPNIISVLATDDNDDIAGYSNYGATSVHVGAPGGADDSNMERWIWSTLPASNYGYMCGTSMAAPHVAGVAALFWGKCLPYVNNNQVKRRILEKVDILSSLNGKCVSNGRVNAYKVLTDSASPNTPSNLMGYATGWTTINLSWSDNSTNEIGFKIERKLSSMPDYIFIKAVDANQTSSFDGTAQGGEVNFYRVKSWNMAGDSEPSMEIGVLIPATAPLAPTGLTGRWDWGRRAVSLSWTDISNNELEFIIERRAEWEAEWTAIGFVSQNQSFYYDNDVAGDTFYYYRIKASNPIGYSYSYEVEVYVPIH